MRTIGLVTAAAAIWLGSTVAAAAELTWDEGVCERKASLAAWKYFGAKNACLVSCQRGVRADTTDPADCVPPYGSGPTFGCIQGKQGRTNGRICSGCNPDPPECYPADVCPQTTIELVTYIDLVIDMGFMPAIYCDDAGSPDGLTPLEGRCADSVAKYISKAAYARAKCFAKCRTNEQKGVIPPGSCPAPAPSDPSTLTCLAKVSLATAPRIDRYCGAPYGDAPECHAITSGGDWIALTEMQADAFDGYFYCEN
jgi:hypothetical protein